MTSKLSLRNPLPSLATALNLIAQNNTWARKPTSSSGNQLNCATQHFYHKLFKPPSCPSCICQLLDIVQGRSGVFTLEYLAAAVFCAIEGERTLSRSALCARRFCLAWLGAQKLKFTRCLEALEGRKGLMAARFAALVQGARL